MPVFASPWLLLGLLVLPLVWWLIRATNPHEERQIFPPLDFLRHLPRPPQAPPRRRPWWLVLLRLGGLAALCLAAAHPQWVTRDAPQADGPLRVLLDDGWASAADWSGRMQALHRLLDRAERQGTDILVQPAAPGWDGLPPPRLGPAPAAQLRPLLARLEPKPWPTRRQDVLAGLHDFPQAPLVWICDGLADQGSEQVLAEGPRLTVLLPERPVHRLLGVERQGQTEWVRVAPPGGVMVDMLDEQGMRLHRQPDGEPVALAGDLRNRIRRFQVSGENSAAATFWLDGGWHRPQVGLVEDAMAPTPLLSDSHYLAQGLLGRADLRRGRLAEVLDGRPTALMLPDSAALSAQDVPSVLAWVRAGGVLVRFAGPRLAESLPPEGDPLLPVWLRPGLRVLGGSLSWTSPLAVGEFAADSPLAGLVPPPDVTVKRQMLADPQAGHEGRVWASLSDGTPLVSGRREGQGWLVFVHVAAHPGWSSLPLSGLWLDLLQRLVGLGQSGSTATATDSPAAEERPRLVVDGSGHRRPLPHPAPPPRIAGQKLAGLYGQQMVNLGPLLAPPSSVLPLPHGIRAQTMPEDGVVLDGRPPLLALAALLWLLDGMLRLPWPGWPHMGRSRRPGTGLAVAGLAVAGLMADPAQAADTLRLALWQPAPVSVLAARQGLDRLSQVVRQRSAVPLAEPLMLTRLDDSLLECPLLYWPLDPATSPLLPDQVDRLNHFMRVGGVLVVAGPGDDPRRILSRIAPGLDIPPLRRVDQNHVLARTFYLLRDQAAPLLERVVLAADPAPDSDGTSPLVLVDQILAEDWQQDSDRSPSFRLGVNLVLYALTGTYKADQVHIPSMLERLGR